MAAGFALSEADVTTDVRPPIELRTSDGNALKLTTVDARSVVQGPLVFTELRLAFDNPDSRTIEGRFHIALPPGASISRFGMKIGGAWQEGEVVERKNANRIYDDFLHKRVDPALLEQGAGNAFDARVFPILAHERKELVVAYSQEVTSDRDVIVPLRGLPALDQLDISVTSDGGAEAQRLSKASYEPKGDITLTGTARNDQGLRNGNLVLARVKPDVGSRPEPLRSALILVDTSASRAFELDAQVRLVASLAKRMAARKDAGKLVVACFDQEVEQIFEGPPGDFGRHQQQEIRRRRALGASDMELALSWAGAVADKHHLDRLLLIGDGVVTAGDDTDGLSRAARKLRGHGVVRLDAVAFGGIRDEESLRSLVTSSLTHDGVVIDGSEPSGEIWRRLELATRSDVTVEVAEARWWWPKRIEGVQPGDEVLVYAELPASQPVQIRLDGRAVDTPALREAPRPLLERSWARAKIGSLLDEQRHEGRSEELTQKIVALSTRHRVLSPYTALLVLETQRDYDRYGLGRDALADILTVQDGRLAVAQRQAAAPAKAAPTAPWGRDDSLAQGNMWGDSIGDSFGAGGLGLSGIGEGGGGRGEGIGLGNVGTIGRGAGTGSRADARAEAQAEAAEFGMTGMLDSGASGDPSAGGDQDAASGSGQGFGAGHGRLGRSHRTHPPRVRMGATSVSGRLPPEIIQRIVRQNFGRFRACYEQGLLANPSLNGRIGVRFIIGRDGHVSGVQASQGTTMPEAVSSCVVRSFYGLTFPVPEGGIVTVVYPIVFTPDGSTPAPAADPAPSFAGTPSPPPQREQPAVARPYRGKLESIMDAIADKRADDALEDAQAWQAEEPGDVLAIVALGEALEATGHPDLAARSYGSIIDLFPSRVDLRRYAGERLERVPGATANRLAIDTYRKAISLRPDHASGHRLLGYALLQQGRHAEAFEALRAGLEQAQRRGNSSVASVLRADVGLAVSVWLASAPSKRDHIVQAVQGLGVPLSSSPSLRFVLHWETDVNDVDLHVYDAQGNHAFYGTPALPSGGRLYGDVTTGYGPELFEIAGSRRSAGYRLQVHYYSRGPMGYGMGLVQIVEHDGKGGLKFDERPFLVMTDRAFVDVGGYGSLKDGKLKDDKLKDDRVKG